MAKTKPSQPMIDVKVVSEDRLQAVELLRDFIEAVQSRGNDGVVASVVDGQNVRTLVMHLAPGSAKLSSANVVKRLEHTLNACLVSLNPECLSKEVVDESNKAVTASDP